MGSSLSFPLPPSFVSSQGDEGAALLAVEEVCGSPGSPHSAVACRFAVVRLQPYSLSVCVCVCVRVALPCLLPPPPTLSPLSSCLSSQVKRWRMLPGVQNNGCSFQVSAALAAAGLGSTCQSQALEFGL
ncbi:hypothetical protein AMECASPLE_015629 [Ameca splendens]|uniref:Uncharacterized protein n=1 Tax=Ameca splendens TaxID=208324 RepID=A0ABV0YQ92_9TELE